MNEGQFKKKMQHFLEINNALYKENQAIKKALEYQENQNNNYKKEHCDWCNKSFCTEQNTDNYAIEFAEWICKNYETDAIFCGILDTKELLKIFKKQIK